jgi:hypothetical protein
MEPVVVVAVVVVDRMDRTEVVVAADSIRRGYSYMDSY